MNEIDPYEDFEKASYLFLGKMKDHNITNAFDMFVKKTNFLYQKRFGDSEYIKSVSTKDMGQYIKELTDCVNYLKETDKDTKEVFKVFTSKPEMEMTMAAVSTIMLRS